MRRAGSFLLFLAAAAALHLAAFLSWPEAPGGAASSSGAGGAEAMTVAAASPQLAELVEAWDRPPEAAEAPLAEAPALAPEAPPQPVATDAAPSTAGSSGGLPV